MTTEQQADELAEKAAFIIANRITVNGKNIMLQKDWETANLICKQLIIQELNLAQLLWDKEILDWLEKNNVSINQLRWSGDSVKEYWHLYWGDNPTRHFGNQDTALASLRQAILAAMKQTEEKGSE